MTSDSIISGFFELAHEALTDHDEAGSIFVHYLDMFSSIATESFYVIDLQERKFCYVSPNSSFLCGYTVEEALMLGYDFFSKIVHPEDLPSAQSTHKAILRYLSAIGEQRDEINYFSLSFRLQQKYSFLSTPLTQMIYHRVKPVWIDDRLRYFICSVGCSVAKERGKPRVYYKDGLTYEEYSFTTQRWKRTTVEPLTERERAILMLSRQGNSGKEIAGILFMGYKTFQNSVIQLYTKLGVSAMQQAIIFASNRRMIFASPHYLVAP